MNEINTYIGHFISGKYYVDNGEKIDILNPCNNKLLGILTSATEKTVKKAIDDSENAFQSWKRVPISKRVSILFNYKNLLEKNIDKISSLISNDLGKVKEDAKAELRRGIENVEYACGIGDLIKGEYNKNISTSVDTWSEFEPLGVVLGITPFNFPTMVPLWMFPLAIAAGNTFILKPSEKDPLSTLVLGELLTEAGLPNGVFNIVNGNKSSVDYILKDDRIKAVSFVGSTPVAKEIYKLASNKRIRCQALGGAKNHALILPDADIEDSTKQIISAAFGSSGQRCMALSVAVLVGDIKEKFMDVLIKKTKELKVGLDINDSNSFGPLISADHLKKVKDYIDISEEEGGKILVDGRRILQKKNSIKGNYLGATIIDGVNTSMTAYKNEIFGPVLQIINVETFDEGLEIIKNNNYGNGCAVFTKSGDKARTFSDNVDIGMIGVNIPLPVPSSCHSFGGWKDSFFGDLNIYGPDGLRFYTQRKTITQKWPSSKNQNSKINLSMPTN